MDKELKIFIILIISILILLFTGMFKLSKVECKAKAEKQELEYSFGLIEGCMVKEKNGKWIDYQRLRYME